MSLKGLSDYDQYGVKEDKPVWPFRCEFRPFDPCGFPDEWEEGGYLKQLTSGCIKVGTPLFELHCMTDPEELGGYLIHIGTIRTTSEMVTSLYGDTRLFYRHVRFEEDLEERPEWKPHVDLFTRPTFTKLLPLPKEAPQACPFDYLFGTI